MNSIPHECLELVSVVVVAGFVPMFLGLMAYGAYCAYDMLRS